MDDDNAQDSFVHTLGRDEHCWSLRSKLYRASFPPRNIYIYVYVSSGNFFPGGGGGGEKGIRISSSEANARSGLSRLSGINRRGEYSVLNFEEGIKNRYVDRMLNEGREHLR